VKIVFFYVKFMKYFDSVGVELKYLGSQEENEWPNKGQLRSYDFGRDGVPICAVPLSDGRHKRR
jgi:hypothetical protein